MQDQTFRPRRSVLYVPASNEKALAKVGSLNCDAIIFDLEDAVAPAEKAAARERLKQVFGTFQKGGAEKVIRINGLTTEWGADDLAAARACRPDAILLPKVATPRDIHDADEVLDEEDADLRIWAMIETPRAMLNLGPIAELGRDRAARLSCFVVGTNDLAKETGIAVTNDRRFLAPHLAHIVMAARAGGLDVLDGPLNDFSNATVFEDQCRQAAQMGFDGKTLIHPSQIDAANKAFAPPPEALEEARAVVATFALPENAGKGVISFNGRMVERLHLSQAERLIARAATITERQS
ncbi:MULTISPECIES: HpcH/HpaI aldolase/citrate lyase family protein [Mesorhizobium]|uniref:CoA ester lyase n=1 Tax=Mesorhizobium denitrificans TaxID=2294114 RepID=A0A371XGN3_9HYPH|nr:MULTISPECIES: CoA ester lyase [Mesorhizobium]RFC68381.1 CoA ester lyase [Mesorhizobium denitrificans]